MDEKRVVVLNEMRDDPNVTHSQPMILIGIGKTDIRNKGQRMISIGCIIFYHQLKQAVKFYSPVIEDKG